MTLPAATQLGERLDSADTVMGAVSVLGMGLMVWFLVPEPRRDDPVHA